MHLALAFWPSVSKKKKNLTILALIYTGVEIVAGCRRSEAFPGHIAGINANLETSSLQTTTENQSPP
jgi:hypothetical protein